MPDDYSARTPRDRERGVPMSREELRHRHELAAALAARRLIRLGFAVEMPDHSLRLTAKGEKMLAKRNPEALAKIVQRGGVERKT